MELIAARTLAALASEHPLLHVNRSELSNRLQELQLTIGWYTPVEGVEQEFYCGDRVRFSVNAIMRLDHFPTHPSQWVPLFDMMDMQDANTKLLLTDTISQAAKYSTYPWGLLGMREQYVQDEPYAIQRPIIIIPGLSLEQQNSWERKHTKRVSLDVLSAREPRYTTSRSLLE